MTPARRKLYRTVNAVFWIAVFIAAVVWSESWNDWFAMLIEAAPPAMLGGYIHLVLRPGGTSG